MSATLAASLVVALADYDESVRLDAEAALAVVCPNWSNEPEVLRLAFPVLLSRGALETLVGCGPALVPILLEAIEGPSRDARDKRHSEFGAILDLLRNRSRADDLPVLARIAERGTREQRKQAAQVLDLAGDPHGRAVLRRVAMETLENAPDSLSAEDLELLAHADAVPDLVRLWARKSNPETQSLISRVLEAIDPRWWSRNGVSAVSPEVALLLLEAIREYRSVSVHYQDGLRTRIERLTKLLGELGAADAVPTLVTALVEVPSLASSIEDALSGIDPRWSALPQVREMALELSQTLEQVVKPEGWPTRGGGYHSNWKSHGGVSIAMLLARVEQGRALPKLEAFEDRLRKQYPLEASSGELDEMLADIYAATGPAWSSSNETRRRRMLLLRNVLGKHYCPNPGAVMKLLGADVEMLKSLLAEPERRSNVAALRGLRQIGWPVPPESLVPLLESAEGIARALSLEGLRTLNALSGLEETVCRLSLDDDATVRSEAEAARLMFSPSVIADDSRATLLEQARKVLARNEEPRRAAARLIRWLVGPT